MNCLVRALRLPVRVRRSTIMCMRMQSSEPISIPASEDEVEPVSPKIQSLVENITKLTLVEVAELSKVLKRTLNLPDASVMSFGAVSQVAKEAEEEEHVPTVIKSTFTVKLKGFNDAKKVALIKEIKNVLQDMNLVQAKKFVESAPVVVKTELSKDDSEKLVETLQAAGGECVIE